MTDEQANREIEAKFEVDEAGRQALLALEQLGAYRVRSRRQRRQDDLYFDTADAALRRAGSTLRVRRLPDGAVVTFKGKREPSSGAGGGDAHLASRAEDEVPIAPELAEGVSATAALPDAIDVSPVRRARAIVGDTELQPTARLLNERVVIELAHPEGHKLELAVDRVAGTRLADQRMVEFDEVELESKGADRALLLEAQRALQERVPGLRPSHTTKLERVLGRERS